MTAGKDVGDCQHSGEARSGRGSKGTPGSLWKGRWLNPFRISNDT